MHYPRRPAFQHSTWASAALVLLAVLIAPSLAGIQVPNEHLFEVKASSYEYAPATLRVSPGDQVTLRLTSLDYVHGLYIDGYDIDLVADPGQTAQVSFVADKPGTFRMRCSVTCGPMHPFMIGKFVVGDGLLWLQAGALAVAAAFLGMKWGRR